MSRLLYGNLDLVLNQLLNARLQMLGADPSPLEAQVYYNSTTHEIRYHDGTTWKALGTSGAGGPPSGAAGGDLTGSYPNPTIAALAVTDAKVAAANKDGVAGTASMRTLGTGAQQAAAGNDSRFGAASPPNGAAGGDLTGSYPNPGIAAGVIVDADVSASAAIAQSKIATLVSDLAAKLASTTAASTYLPLAAPTVSSGDLTLVRDPTAALHAATKQYVDVTSQGFSFKTAVRVVATTNQATLSGLIAIDGVTVSANDRVLLAGQTTLSTNGIWIAAAGAWARAGDMNATGELSDGTLVPVADGTTYQDTLWLCTAITVGTPWAPGTSGSVWTRFSGVSDLVAGAGLTKTGTTIDVVGDATLSVAADTMSVVSAPKWTTPRTLSLTGAVTGSAAVDGTGNVSISTSMAIKTFWINLGSSPQVITHGMSTRDVFVTVYQDFAPYAEIDVEVEHTSLTTITLRYNPAPPGGQHRVIVMGF